MKRISTIMIASLLVMGTTAVAQSEPVPGKNGNKYVPYEERTGNESIVYFTRNLSAEGLIEAYEQVSADIKGHTGVKLHTGEQNGPNIIPREWVKALFRKDLSDANIVETNTYYEGDRYTTEQHRRTLEVNGWTFCPVDILDEEDTLTLPVHGGKWFGKMSVGSHTTDYNSLVVLTHFKGHTQGGFGGSNKNIGIGCADGRIGKAWIHTTPGQDNQWDIREEEFMERMTESTKGCHRLLRQANHVCQCDAQHVGIVRLRGGECRSCRDPECRYPFFYRYSGFGPGMRGFGICHDRSRTP